MPPPLSTPMPIAAQHAAPMPMHGQQPMQGMQPGMGTPMGGQDLSRTNVHAPPGLHAMPAQPQMLSIAKPGMGAPQHTGQGIGMRGPAQPEPRAGVAMMPQAQPQSGNLQMMRVDSSAHAKRPAPAQRTAPGTRPANRPEAKPSAASRSTNLSSSAPLHVAPKKGKGMMYAAIFVVLALGIGAVVAKMVLKVF